MRQILLQLYLTSSIFVLVAGILIGRISVQMQSTVSEPVSAATTSASTSLNELPVAIEVKRGAFVFRLRCASCHNKNMIDDLTGPALAGTEERWEAYPREDLYAWIRNSQALVASGHPRAVKLYREWDKSVMTAFPKLSDEDIEDLLSYIASQE